jgi:hypothetical protein
MRRNRLTPDTGHLADLSVVIDGYAIRLRCWSNWAVTRWKRWYGR